MSDTCCGMKESSVFIPQCSPFDFASISNIPFPVVEEIPGYSERFLLHSILQVKAL
jgi:hypothetical protein